MTVIALGSVHGAPGVTTTALALAAVWARPVLIVEADPYGGSIAARWSSVLHPERNLLGLAATRDRVTDPAAVLAHSQPLPGPDGQVRVLLGPLTPEQAVALGPWWPRLAATLPSLGVDVVVDCGRLGAGPAGAAMAASADRVALLAHAVPEQLLHVQTRIAALRRVGAHSVGVVLVGEHAGGRPASRRSYTAEEVAAELGVDVLADLPIDSATANMLNGHPAAPWRRRRLGASRLVRAVAGLADRLRSPVIAAAS